MKPEMKRSLLARKNVLIADDEPDIRTLVATTFEGMGCTSIVEAADGNEAKNAIEERLDDLHLVICDWNMPAMTGMELLTWIRGKRQDLPFMIITGMNEVGSVVRAVSSGVSGYILKPFGPDRLEEKILEVLHP